MLSDEEEKEDGHKKKAICSGFFVLCVRISSWKLETTDGGHRQISIAFFAFSLTFITIYTT